MPRTYLDAINSTLANLEMVVQARAAGFNRAYREKNTNKSISEFAAGAAYKAAMDLLTTERDAITNQEKETNNAL